MKIGIFLNLPASGGGAFQYSLTVVHCLQRYDDKNEYVLFYLPESAFPIQPFVREGWQTACIFNRWQLIARRMAHALGYKSFGTWRDKFRARRFVSESRPQDEPTSIRHRKMYQQRMEQYGIELMIYPAPTTVAFEVTMPYIFAVHDLQHRLQPHFHEVADGGEFESREYIFQNGIKYAMKVLVDSEVGKEDVLNCYEVDDPDKITVLPFLPAYTGTDTLGDEAKERVKRKYNLPERYIFYPAQFWAHKNHANLVRALHWLKMERHLEVPAIFAGSKQNSFDEVMALVGRLGLQQLAGYLGYVPGADMPALYALATALVMPTFFGPTNIPVLEAFALGCPVITSDLRGIREQVEDAGVLVNPNSVQEIADAIYRVFTDDTLRQRLIEKGYDKVNRYTEKDFARILLSAIDECEAKLRSRK
jgi:glycosyltransferase involved in cell wall biosynthesis